MAPQLPPDAAVGGGILTVVAVDKDKHSASAVKWAVDCLLVNNNITLILVHVRTKSSAHHNSSPDANGGASDQDSQSVFTPFRAYSARKGLIVKEVIVEDSDVSKALVEYINKYRISNIVLGASTRSAIARKFWTHDVPTIINKTAPDFCSVYVISKGKQQSFRPAARPLACAPSQAQFTPPHTRPPFRNTSAELEDVRHSSHMRGEQNTRPKKGLGTDSFDAPIRRAKNSSTHNSLSDNESEVLASFRQGSLDLTVQNVDFTRVSDGSNDGNSTSKDMEAEMKRLKLELKQTIDMYNTACKEAVSAKQMAKQLKQWKMEEVSTIEQVKLSEEAALAMVEMEKAKCKAIDLNQKDFDAEMNRLKLELKQTMDMYNRACKEAVSAKQKAKQLQQWKMEEAHSFEKVKLSKEAALAMVEMEKAKCKADIEAVEKAQKLAEMEAQRVNFEEMTFKNDAQEKNQALNALSHDSRYRKYAIEEIEAATDKFSQAKKIGEGGYGPVFNGKHDHTPVAIKVLRPDAAQGGKQFQQEVEILSIIRHPNMVHLLGACHEYGSLVYEYMNYGRLEDRLFRKGNTPPIPCGIRVKIAADIAIGLLFLHQSKPEPLVHQELKPANILLDCHFVCKINDVGLARLVP